MLDNAVKKLIKDAFEDIDYQKLILFGSQASGMASQGNDYDLMLILKDSFPVPEKISLSTRLRKTLAQHGIDADIIIKSTTEVDYLREKTGSIVRHALQEGVAL
ncbi:nucleotidyltransferase domain-containing protein [bacterium]|nr:nucleotidyltransferase domain-containing protein [bacterium]MBU1651145.1 nucleotidyltransferase domain-containing protein [bacterium]MBU1881543.1 nucleotidyltransferase domain-containing protein [bacterium]